MRNLFGNQISHIEPQAPRDPRTLRGLDLKRPLTKSPVLFFVPFCILFALMMPLMMLSDAQIRSDRRATQGNLKRASGTVTKTGWQRIGNNRNGQIQNYVVNYKFQVEGQTFFGQTTVYQGSPFLNQKIGAKVPVLYAPENPGLNGLAGEWGKNSFPIELFALLPLLFIFMFAPVMLWPLKHLFQARRVFKNGIMAVGHVTWIKRQNQFFFATPIGSNYEVFFTFTTSDGQNVRTSQSVDNDWLVNQLKPDDELTVVYLPRKPQQAVFLEAFIE